MAALLQCLGILIGLALASIHSISADHDATAEEYAAVDKHFNECCVKNKVAATLLPRCTFDYLDSGKPERIPDYGGYKEAAAYNSCLFINGPGSEQKGDVRKCCAERGIPAESPCQSALCTQDYYVTMMEGVGGSQAYDFAHEEEECELYGPAASSSFTPTTSQEEGAYPALSEKTREMRRIAFSCWRDLHVAVLRSGPAAPSAPAGQENGEVKPKAEAATAAKIAGIKKADGVSHPATSDKDAPNGDNTEAATVATDQNSANDAKSAEQIPTVADEGQMALGNIGNDGHDGSVGVWQEAQQGDKGQTAPVNIGNGHDGTVGVWHEEAQQVVETQQVEQFEQEVKVEQGPDGAVQESREAEQVVETQQVKEVDEVKVAKQATAAYEGDKAIVD